MSSRGGWVVRARDRIVEVLIQPAPRRHAGFLGVAVQRGVGELDAQRHIVDGQAEEVLEEHDAGLTPRDLREVAACPPR